MDKKLEALFTEAEEELRLWIQERVPYSKRAPFVQLYKEAYKPGAPHDVLAPGCYRKLPVRSNE